MYWKTSSIALGDNPADGSSSSKTFGFEIKALPSAKRALNFCNRGYVLDQGRNAYTGLGKDLLKDKKVIDLYLGKL